MKTFYALIDTKSRMHYGYTFDEKKAREEADRIEKEDGDVHIAIYEFEPYEEF
jgi:hypothetical protein